MDSNFETVLAILAIVVAVVICAAIFCTGPILIWMAGV